MLNYGHERVNSRFSITIHRTQYSRLNSSKLKNFNGNTRFKNTQLRGFMRNYGHEKTRLEGLNNNMELRYTNLLILILTSSKCSSNR
ncbi:hypothetical protein MTR67_044025 [Solanum verrucosum]|uniref:Uncharacterized protein n=1 Tax=Solanum verrucosum TaxID=315347 RepID=A0AAF0URF4_SOLVR|nr:hypothetical protein MTR67_044025 [Solanum verrucosum]